VHISSVTDYIDNVSEIHGINLGVFYVQKQLKKLYKHVALDAYLQVMAYFILEGEG
jgi:hypothetical protein